MKTIPYRCDESRHKALLSVARDSGTSVQRLFDNFGKGVRKRGQFLILICKAAKATPRFGPQVESRVGWRDLSRHESR